MTNSNRAKQVVRDRSKLILQLIETGRDIKWIEQEITFFVFDVIQFIRNKELPVKEAAICFKKISKAFKLEAHNQLSEEIIDLLNEGLILDEIKTKYGANINSMFILAMKVIENKVTEIEIDRKLKKPVLV